MSRQSAVELQALAAALEPLVKYLSARACQAASAVLIRAMEEGVELHHAAERRSAELRGMDARQLLRAVQGS